MQTRSTAIREHHQKVLISTLKKTYDKENTPHLYIQARARQIVSTLVQQSEFFSSGFSQIITQETQPQQDIDRIVIVAVLGAEAITQLERFWHLFKQVSIINLNLSGPTTKELIKVSPLRKKIKGFIEISLNFLPFIDSVYTANTVKKEPESDINTSFEQSLTSFLVSLPKFHEYQLSLMPNSTSKQLGSVLKQRIQEKLSILESHQCKEYSSSSSPRLKVLILQRKIDQMSPLAYSFHYGAIAQEIEVFDQKHKQFTTNSALFKTLFPMDVEQASQFLASIAKDKAQNQKQKFKLHQFQKAKRVITKHYDQHTTPQQIQLQIDSLKSVKEFCKRRTYTTALQQTIINNRNENDIEMKPGRVVDYIVEWANYPLQEYKPSQDDYTKIALLSYMVNKFWFWQRRIINAGIDSNHKDRIIEVCRKVEGKFKPLKEKPQGEERLDLFRHQPQIVEQAKKWLKSYQPENYQNIIINQSSINRQSKKIVAVKGPLGYGQLALLLKQLKQIDPDNEIVVFCTMLVTTKDYLKIILKEGKSK